MRAFIIAALALVAAAVRPQYPSYTQSTTYKPTPTYKPPAARPHYPPFTPSTTYKPSPKYKPYSTTPSPYKSYSTYKSKPEYPPPTYDSDSTYKAKPIAILEEENIHPGDGTYQFRFSTENGIYRSESGVPKPGYGKDSYGQSKDGYRQEGSWTYSDEYGNPITVTFVADENGYQPSSDILPKPVPTEYPPPEVNPNYVDPHTTQYPPHKDNSGYGEPYPTYT